VATRAFSRVIGEKVGYRTNISVLSGFSQSEWVITMQMALRQYCSIAITICGDFFIEMLR
jgi:hypothetical protein